MTALAAERRRRTEIWRFHKFTLDVGNKAYKNGIACIDLSTGLCEPAHVEADLLAIGMFTETVDATSAQKLVTVDLGREVQVEWLNNDGTNPVLAANVGSDCYLLDDQTVSISSATGARSVAGRVWAVSATDGVAVEIRR